MQRLLSLTLAGLLTVLAPLAVELGMPVSTAVAAEDDEKPQKTRRVPSMSEATFKKLSEAQEFIDAKDLQGALGVLNGMMDRKKRMNGNEIGQVHNMRGFVYFSMENYDQALKEYEQVIAQGEDIPEGLEVTTLYTLAQLSFVADRYDDALRYMETWLTKANNPGPDPHIFMGQVYYQKKDYPSLSGRWRTGSPSSGSRMLRSSSYPVLRIVWFLSVPLSTLRRTADFSASGFSRLLWWGISRLPVPAGCAFPV